MKDNSGPAFPTPHVMGMSLRDFFAAKMLPIAYKMVCETTGYDVGGAPEEVARRAYEYADAMIAERRK